MRKFYIVIQKGAPLAHQLSWSNYIELLPLNDINKINYYINECLCLNLTKRELRNKIKSNEYERLPEETKVKLRTKEELEVKDLIKNPITIKNPNNIICKKDNEYILEYCSKKRITSKEYILLKS